MPIRRHRPRPCTHRPSRAGAGLLALAALGLGACTSNVNFSQGGSAPAAATHLWISIEAIWVASAADTLPEATSGWTKSTLAVPVTVDLATLTPGTLAQLATAVNLPAGTYQQVHLVTADPGAKLVSSASTAGLSYNQQITISDANGSTLTGPLESPVPGGGITIPTSLAITGTVSSTDSSSASGSTGSTSSASTKSTANVALVVDAARDIVSYAYGNYTGFILSPITSAVNESRAGGISGTVDPSALASGHGPVTVSAEVPDATGTHNVVIARTVVAADNTFTLYPLPAPASGSTDYDLVISCAGAETVIIRQIPVPAATVGSAVSVQSAAIPLTAASTAYADVAATSPLLPAGTRVDFYQTPDAASGDALPYVVDSTAVDLLSRRLPNDAFALSRGPMQIGTYQSGSTTTLATVAPVEGAGGYLVGSEAMYRTDAILTAAPAVITGTSTQPTEVLAPVPPLASGYGRASLTVRFATTPGAYDSGFVLIASGNRIIDTVNAAALVAGGGGQVTFTGLAGGGAVAAGSPASSGIPYQVSLRAWNSGNAASTLTSVAGTASVHLAAGSTAAITLPTP